MFGGKELRALELRRQELVLRSTINRLAIRLELQNMQTALRPAEQVFTSVRAVRPWLLLLAPLAGMLAARGMRGKGGGFSKLVEVLKWIPSLLGLWKQFTAATTGTKPETPPAPKGASAEV